MGNLVGDFIVVIIRIQCLDVFLSRVSRNFSKLYCILYFFIRRISMKDVPSSTEEEAAQFCSDIFKEKVRLFGFYSRNELLGKSQGLK